MIKVTFRNVPLAYSNNYTRTFSNLEDAIKSTKGGDAPIMIAMEEEGKGYHYARLNEDGSVNLNPMDRSIKGHHKSDEYKQALEDLKKPKLA